MTPEENIPMPDMSPQSLVPYTFTDGLFVGMTLILLVDAGLLFWRIL